VSLSGDIVVTGLGAVSPVGLCVQATCAALRAGIARMGEIETHFVDGELLGKVPVIGGRVPTERFEEGCAPDEWPGHDRFEVPPPPSREKLVAPGTERLVELALPAAREALSDARPAPGRGETIGLYFGTDEQDDPTPLTDALKDVLGDSLEVAVAVPGGRAGALAAISVAIADLRAGKVQGVLAGGVDSLVRGPVLVRLEAAGILKSESVPQGVIPGEAAAFLYLETGESARKRGARVLARLLSAGTDVEPSAGTNDPNRGAGLTRVLHQVCRDAGGLEAPPLVICDLNGDRYRALEWAMASVRTVGKLHGDMEILHPADCIGDCGAASGALNAAWAIVALLKGYAGAARVLVWGGSEGKMRAAAVFAPPV
jgi:3-oxoacyl-[acyl-carrier-protein] synthase-1